MPKSDLLRLPGALRFWSSRRKRELHREYEERREHYEAIVRKRGLVYREADVPAMVASRFASRGYTPARKEIGQVHTFAFIPRLGWHTALYPDLQSLGPLSEYDYVAHGYHADEFYRRDDAGARRRAGMNEEFLERLRAAHRERPVDWVFVYASGLEMLPDTLRRVREELGLPLVNMCLDDKQSWAGPIFAGYHLGQIDIAPEFDLSWTSARIACDWYLAAGGVPLYMPEGFDPQNYRPMDVTRDIPVSFIGGAYGFRPAVIDYLREHDVDIHVFGGGWNTRSVWGDEQVEIMNRSVINLGMGGIGYSEDLTNVKTRDFEIPGTGGGVYLTSFNPDLATHFVIGEEILCYRTRDEMLELIRYYVRRPEEARAIAERGRERCLREHRWLHRYVRVCEVLGIL